MISLKIIILIAFIHWIADFILQSNKMSQEKSHSLKWLSIHVAIYTIPWLIFSFTYAVINGVLRWAIDFNTSKLTHKLWDKKEAHWFFAVIGFDQFLHFACLFGSYWLLFR
jgi:hypothetical protein